MEENNKAWWSTWAPFWDMIENRHFGTVTTDYILNDVVSPVLVIGAGQGLIVRYLKEKGYDAVGLDLNQDMVDIAKSKYNINLVKGDARNLPFEDKSFKTTIISSGVVDYGADEESIKIMIDEANRVTNGHVYAGFHQVVPKIEKIYRKIGVIDFEKNLRLKRIFDIDKISKKDPLKCIPYIKKWTNKNFFRILFEWTVIGITLPKEMKDEREKFTGIVKMGEPQGITEQMMLDTIPESVPYRSQNEIEELMKRLNTPFLKTVKFDDCVLVQFR
jgi:ubiquinone/menaquinone biosynthesis C-methylase UbiE